MSTASEPKLGIFSHRRNAGTPSTSRANSPRLDDVGKLQRKPERIARSRSLRNLCSPQRQSESPREIELARYTDENNPWKNAQALIDDLEYRCSQSNKHLELVKPERNDFAANTDEKATHEESIDSIESDSEFLLASEVPATQDDIMQHILMQIECTAQKVATNDVDAKKLNTLVNQLRERIISSTQVLKRRIKTMKDAEDVSFAELFLEKNEEMTKLQLEMDGLKQKLKENNRQLDEQSDAKKEVFRLKGILSNRKEEIDQLKYNLIEAKSYIETLEKQRKLLTDMNPDVQSIQQHFETIRKVLLSNQNIVQFVQMKKLQYEN